jgi:hypothetical protein
MNTTWPSIGSSQCHTPAIAARRELPFGSATVCRMGKYGHGSQHELLQRIVDPIGRERLNGERCEENVELREFVAAPADIDWIAPDPATGKELKDAAWKTVGLSGPSPQDAGWWPKSGPTWDGVARVRGRAGSTGALFVEAKGRPGELRGGGTKSTHAGNLAGHVPSVGVGARRTDRT